MGAVSVQRASVQKRRVLFDVQPLDLKGDLRRAIESAWGGEEGWALGHAFDGVVWGYMAEGRLVTARDAEVPDAAELRERTLMDLRVFAADRELRVWRGSSGLSACVVREEEAGPGAKPDYHAIQERAYVLMGAGGRPAPGAVVGGGRFVELVGLAGQRHTPPRLRGAADAIPARLRVQHYFERRDNGLLRMAEHRLLGLCGSKEQ